MVFKINEIMKSNVLTHTWQLVGKTGTMSAENCQFMSIQLKNLNILMLAQYTETGPCTCPIEDLMDQ